MKTIFALVSLIAVLIPIVSFAQVSISGNAALFCDPFDIGIYEQKGITYYYIYRYIILFGPLLLIAAVIIIILYHRAKKKLPKPGSSGDEKLMRRVDRLWLWRTILITAVIFLSLTAVASYALWYLAQDEYRAQIQNLHDMGCAGY